MRARGFSSRVWLTAGAACLLAALVVLLPAADAGYTTHGGTYPVQDTRDPEERVWLCVATAGFDACTTHLARTSSAIALRQCGYLLDTAIPGVHAQTRYLPTVVGGDFNLRRLRKQGGGQDAPRRQGVRGAGRRRHAFPF